MLSLKLPIHWDAGTPRKPDIVFLGMNFYRNAHFQVLNRVKKQYTDSLFPYLKGKKLKTPISITYIFRPSRTDQDLDNVISVASKFLQDSLVHYGVIENDTYNHISLTTNMVGEKDKEGYIEAIIEEINLKSV